MAERISRRWLSAAAERAARSHPTPFYLFDAATAVRSLRAWCVAAGPKADLFYPWKCNRLPALVTLADREGWGAEVTTADDLAGALAASREGRRVLLQGPAKERRSIDAALGAGAWLVSDGPEDAAAILGRARALALAPRYLLRFRPSATESSQRKFGMSGEEVVAFVRRVARDRGTLPEGLAFHLGTGLPSLSPFRSAIREAGRLASALSTFGVSLQVLDVGGGFASRGESRRDLRGRDRGPGQAPRSIVRELVVAARRAAPGARLFIEPGRAVASDAFHLVARVVGVTARRVYVDASRMSHAFFVPRGRHAFVPLPRRPGKGLCEVAGPLPVDLDVLSARESIGRPRVGDLLVIGSVGAYNLIAANTWAGPLPDVVEISERASADDRRSCGPPRR